jgi:hypothetical protein
MKRITLAVCAGLLCTGLLATPADAAVRHFEGSVAGGGTVEFDVLFQRGKPRQAGGFDFDGIPVDCEPTDTRVNFNTRATVPVRQRDGKFVYSFQGFPGRVAGIIRLGTLDNRVVRATGKVSFGPYDFESSGRTGCTTGGPRNWNAHT